VRATEATQIPRAVALIGLLLVLPPAAWTAEIHEDAGTHAAAFLKNESGSRAAAMAGAYTGLADDVDGLFWNPAGITTVEGRQLTGTHDFAFAGISHETLAYGQRLGDRGVLAVSFQGVFASIERRAGDTLEADSEFTASTYSFGLTYAQSFGGLAIGATVKGIQERFDVDDQTGAAFDVGAVFRNGRFAAGVSALSLGPELGDAPLPRVLRAGLSAPLAKDGPTLAVDGVLPSDDFGSARVGLEQWFGNQVALRAGYHFTKGENPAKGYSVGIGLRSEGTRTLENVKFQLDYAFVPDKGAGDSHRVSFMTRF
jgi:hypothetical protein